MIRSTPRPILVLIVFSAIMAGICAVSFVNALSWLNKPFPGFLIYDPPFVGSIRVVGWPGKEAGLQFLERIVTADGARVLRGEEVVKYARQKGPGVLIRYEVQSKGQTRIVEVPVAVFTLKDFFLAFFVTFLGGLVLFVLGVIAVLFKPTKSTSWVFFGMCFTLSGYMTTSFEILSTYNFVRFHYSVLSIFPITFFHLGLTFPDRKRILTRFPKLEYILYAPALVLIVGYQIYFTAFPTILASESPSWVPSYKLLGSVARLFMLVSVLSLIGFVIQSVYQAPTITARQRARMILFGVTIAFLPSLVLTLFSFFFKFYFPWNFLVFFIIFFPASIAYSIVRHNLFDADLIIKRTVGYFTMTGIVVAAYAILTFVFNVFLEKYEVAQSQVFPILFTMGVILVFNPLRDRMQGLIDRLFFRKEYDYGGIVERVGGAMTSILELPKILKRLTQTFMDELYISTSSVMLLTSAGTYQIQIAEGERAKELEGKAVSRDEALMGAIEREKRELTRNDLIEDPRFLEISEKGTAGFDALLASLMVPLVYQGQVIGCLALGEKKSGKPYKREDIELLRTVANQSAIAVENARLFQENLEKQRMEEELNIARDLQMSMLPVKCPEVEGFSIAASSVPAREVGGDFYDFIEMGEGKVGLIVGDVTGKSVSGALAMSAARSVFRMLSEEGLKVDEIMTRANTRAKKDMKKGMFVALLYVLLDSKERSVIICSAGQTQPIHFSAKEDKARLVQTEGDTFPIGILDDVDYKETRLKLSSGDKLVLYTDGIVEAMNGRTEMFGFERLLGLVEKAGILPADALLREILDKVGAFVNGSIQHDDLTIIIVSMEKELSS